MTEIVEMEGNGRILIPKKVREKLGLAAGSKLRIDIEDNRIILRVVEVRAVEAEAMEEKDGKNGGNGKQLREFLSKH